MPLNRKYGRVTVEKGVIGEDEPVVIFRYSDKFLEKVMLFYSSLCHQGPGVPQQFLDDLPHLLDEIHAWQSEHPELVHTPGR